MNFLQVNGHSLHYQHLKSEARRTFIFLNSLGTDFRIWDEVVPQLQPHGSVLRFDKPGHGLSEIPQHARTIGDYADDVVGLLDTLGIRTGVLVGLSIGGVIAQHLAVQHPTRFDQLVLSNTGPKIGTTDAWNTRIQTVREQGMAAITEGVLERWFPVPFQAAHPLELMGYRRMIAQTSLLGYIRACEALRDTDLTARIPAIQVPTLCIGGTDDLATSPELVQMMAAQIPGSRCEVITGAGHIPCVQMPDTVARLVLDFVGGRE